MALKLKRKNMDPPSGWVFEVENGFHVRAGNFDKLIAKIRLHLVTNDHDIPENLEEVVEEYLCMQNPPGICIGDGPKRFFPTKTQVEAGTKAMIKAFALKGSEALVSKEIAEKRAQECVSCKRNINIWGCFLCTGLMKLITKAYKRSTPLDSHLRACSVCGCVNAAQVHLSEKVLANLPSDALVTDYPDCWKRRLLTKGAIDARPEKEVKKNIQESALKGGTEVPGERRPEFEGKRSDDNSGSKTRKKAGEVSPRSEEHSRAAEEGEREDRGSESVNSGPTEREPSVGGSGSEEAGSVVDEQREFPAKLVDL